MISRMGIPKFMGIAGFCGLILARMLAVPVLPDADATELNASYSNLNVRGFQEDTDAFESDIVELDGLVETLKATEVLAHRAARHRETIAIAEMLADGRRRFERLYRKQAEDMADEVRRAREDERIRKISAGLRLAAGVLQLGAEIYQQSSPAPAPAPAWGGTQAHAVPGLPGNDLNSNAAEGSVSVEQKVRIFTDGQWRTIDVKQMIRDITIPPDNGGPVSPPVPGASGDFLDSPANRFGAWAAELPRIVCDDSFRGCFPVDPELSVGLADGLDAAEIRPEAVAPIAPPQRAPTEAEAALFKVISSIALDLTPFVGTLKSAAEVATGRDPVTGQSLSRAAAAVGFVASAVPGGKLWTKTVGSSALEYGTKWFRHYTSRNGSNGILRTGTVQADRGKIYAESANRKVLAPRDAERRYNIRTGRGRDYVEFQAPRGTRWSEQPGLTRGVTEIVIEGDVPLGQGARVLQRR